MKKIILGAFFLVCTVIINAQEYSKPEHIVFDIENDYFLVSNNGSGTITSLSYSGKTRSFASGFNECMGMCIFERDLFVSCGDQIKRINLDNTNQIDSIELPIASNSWLDGIACDSLGNIYAIDVKSKKIIKTDIFLSYSEIFLDSGLYAFPQDLVFDHPNNRLVVVAYASSSPIQAINLIDTTLADIPNTNMGQYDGIEIAPDGSFYVSTHVSNDKIYKWDPTFSEDPILIAQGLDEPAGLCYEEQANILAVPEFGGDNVVFISLAPSISADFSSDTTTGQAPLNVTFYDQSVSLLTEINNWAWDFQNDLIIDSYDQNPNWVFNEPGNYSVRLVVSNDSISETIIKENYISISQTNIIEPHNSYDIDIIQNHADKTICIVSNSQLRASCLLINTSGKIVVRDEVSGLEDNIDLASIEAGIYILCIQHEEKTILSKKIVIF